MDNKYFNLLRQQIKHTGSIVASIDCIIRYDKDVNDIKEKLRDLLDKDAKFDKIMYGVKND
tara:strand:+ start:253 stop:435 length:183 start_codon:yes stop_codon:yes gene_type:complete